MNGMLAIGDLRILAPSLLNEARSIIQKEMPYAIQIMPPADELILILSFKVRIHTKNKSEDSHLL